MDIHLSDLTPLGDGLNRPECVLATENGFVYTSDWGGGGGIRAIHPSGNQAYYQASNLPFKLRPNGISLMPDGSFLIAHLGDDTGGLYHLNRNGQIVREWTEVDGCPLPPTNYPHVDYLGRIWLTLSTRHIPRADAYRRDITDGFIVLIDGNDVRVVSDNLGYTNECCVHPDGEKLYVNETFSRRLSSFDITQQGDLINKRTVAEFGHGTYPDGLTFDEEGGIWITSIVSNRVIRVAPDGEQTILLEDVDKDHLQWVEQAFLSDKMGRPHLDQAVSQKLKNISSLAFGGRNMKKAYLGCLLGDQVFCFDSPIAGWKPPYWKFPLQI